MPSTKSPQILQVKLTLLDVEPAVWRRVLVPESYSLNRLHDVIQAAMLWLNYHLHEFEIGDRRYADLKNDEDGFGERLYDDRNIGLRDLAARGVERFSYNYDFGDDWLIAVAIEKTAPAEAGVDYPALAGGARAAPPEDCGGPFGFMEFVAAMADENHPDHDELLEWRDGRPFDPEDMQTETVERELRRVRSGRRSVRTRDEPAY